VQTSTGLKPIETFVGGELVWSRDDTTGEQGFQPVVATIATANKTIYQVVVSNLQGEQEIFGTTSEHPFWVEDIGWRKASLLEMGMVLRDRHNQALTVAAVQVLNKPDTVFNIEVAHFHTYHVGQFGVWVHNAQCCVVALANQAAEINKRTDVKQVVQAPAGSKGNWDPRINGKMQPETAYLLDNGHAYITDAAGRVKTVEGKLDLDTMARNQYQQTAVNQAGNPGDHGGHLIASVLGGAGDKVNMVPQAGTLNLNGYRTMERELQRELALGKKVEVKIELVYPKGGGVRPSEFVVTANIGGKIVPYKFKQ
jgi:hypothetical protein